MVDDPEKEKALFPERVGDRLRAARTKAGMDLSDVASKTRVPLRHLQAIESGDYASFPSPTYCIGFVKAYARAIGEDEVSLGSAIRAELGQAPIDRRYQHEEYEDADPARIPSRMLAWTAAAIALLIAIGYGVWRSELLGSPDDTPIAVEAPSVEDVAAVPPPPPTGTAPAATGEVVLTAIDPVWIRVYDAKDKVLLEKELAKGERYVVPADADNPMIRTGRAELLNVTVGGQPVAALGLPERTVKDVGISATALNARPSTSVVPAAPVAVPAANATTPQP